jgi:hypothetical protein
VKVVLLPGAVVLLRYCTCNDYTVEMKGIAPKKLCSSCELKITYSQINGTSRMHREVGIQFSLFLLGFAEVEGVPMSGLRFIIGTILTRSRIMEA